MTEREPTSALEELKIDFRGTLHRGRRVVLMVSDTEVRQEIRYKDLRRVDPDVYARREADFMRAIANEILWRLVAQSMGRRRAPGAASARRGAERRLSSGSFSAN
ncbi:MAG: hypothetical protein ACREI8_02400 [Myxococcota bacterium]